VSWDPFQREVLAELGHLVYRQAGAANASDAEVACVDVQAADNVSIEDQMLVRIARAAGMSTETLQACIGDIQAIAGLRGNASAKRALWPRLRMLRRQAT
jgi:2-hydroxychromene-2-carboxylate isomerase